MRSRTSRTEVKSRQFCKDDHFYFVSVLRQQHILSFREGGGLCSFTILYIFTLLRWINKQMAHSDVRLQSEFTGYELILHINTLNISALFCVCRNSCFTNSLLYESISIPNSTTLCEILSLAFLICILLYNKMHA